MNVSNAATAGMTAEVVRRISDEPKTARIGSNRSADWLKVTFSSQAVSQLGALASTSTNALSGSEHASPVVTASSAASLVDLSTRITFRRQWNSLDDWFFQEYLCNATLDPKTACPEGFDEAVEDYRVCNTASEPLIDRVRRVAEFMQAKSEVISLAHLYEIPEVCVFYNGDGSFELTYFLPEYGRESVDVFDDGRLVLIRVLDGEVMQKSAVVIPLS